MGEEEEELKRFLDVHAKRMENIVQTRFNSMMDQVNKLATEHNALVAKFAIMEKLFRVQSAANAYVASDLLFIKSELDALENYLAQNDEKLKQIIKEESK